MKAYHLLLKYNGAGFWSIFNKLMNYLQNYEPIYKITWDVYSPWNIYGQGEIMGKVFQPYENPSYASYEIEEVICDEYINQRLTGKEAQHLYTEDDYIWRQDLNEFWTTYIHLHEHVTEKFNHFKEYIKGMEKKTIITMLVRHPTLGYEQPNGRMPSFEQYDEVISKLAPKLDDVLLVCMTDLQEAYDYFSEKYGDAIVFPPTARSSKKQGEAFTSQEGDESSAMNALLIAMYLSIGDHFIHHTSNIATAALYMNTTMKSHFLIG